MTIETRAPGTGAALSSRVTKTSVFCGLSLTQIPRLVTWTRLARMIGLSSRVLDARAIGDRRAFLDRGPDQPGARRLQHAR